MAILFSIDMWALCTFPEGIGHPRMAGGRMPVTVETSAVRSRVIVEKGSVNQRPITLADAKARSSGDLEVKQADALLPISGHRWRYHGGRSSARS